MDISKVMKAYEQLKDRRRQLDNPLDSWTPDVLEEWHDAVQQALVDREINDNALDKFNSIPPGKRWSFGILDNENDGISTRHYDESDINDFLQNGIIPSKELLDSIIEELDKYLKSHAKEHFKAVKEQIERIIEQRPV